MNRLLLAIKAVRQLGIQPVGLLTLYRLGLASGYYRWIEKRVDEDCRLAGNVFHIEKIFDLPSREMLLACLSKSEIEKLRNEADEIVNGKVRLFGGEPVDLQLKPLPPLTHWTDYETGKISVKGDIKMIWEPARFGWAYILARAFYIFKESKYAVAFWRLTAGFLEANPPYKGPHWMSGQEVALRMIALTYAAQVFNSAEITVPKQIAALGKVIAVHARRIPPTLIYARAQKNNHLLSEATGLITAAHALPRHPQAERWLKLGWHWFNRGLEMQISEEGVYIQHSANYQRLMLQLALWTHLLSQYQQKSGKNKGGKFIELRISNENIKRLHSATQWLLDLMEKKNGAVPNLGPNDGAYIQPLTVCPFADYRPVLQTSSAVFGDNAIFGNKAWDEMGLWYGVRIQQEERKKAVKKISEERTPHILINPISQSWGYLRIANHSSRPGHADQLHFDLWRQGINIAQDAGTFSYNDPFPWDNALSRSDVHNTVSVNGCDQMLRAGKFLWLDWAQAKLVEYERGENGHFTSMTAEHVGYARFGILHQRSVVSQMDGSWLVEDKLLLDPSFGLEKLDYTFRVHWLLCNTPWEWDEDTLTLFTNKGICTVQINSEKTISYYQVVRGGELLAGEGDISPTWGWTSPTYGKKDPAISLSAIVIAKPPVKISTFIRFHNY
ncbi:MAG: alginate lyase family protein [Anaerolineales bacterium]|nr:alginate lyase family protein [Anaerolineales bacterium]